MKQAQSKPQVSWVAFIAAFLALACVLSVVSIVLVASFQREKIEAKYFAEANNSLEDVVAIIDERISQQRQQVHFLHATPPIRGIYRAENEAKVDPKDSTTQAQWVKRLETIFVAFLESNPSIVEASYVDVRAGGQEVLRVERLQGNVSSVDRGMLRKQNEEQYYQELLELPPNAIYTSNIGLKREYGRIEFPTWSTYKIAKAVYDEEGKVFGYIILHFFAGSLLDHVRNAGTDHQQIFLLNSDGGFLIHPNKKYEFGFELGNSANWESIFGNFAEYSGDYDNPVYKTLSESEHLYFTEQELLLDWPGSGRLVKPVIAVSAKVIRAELWEIKFFYSLVILATVFVVMVAVVIYRFQVSRELNRYIREAEFEAIFLGSRDAIVALDKKGKIKSWNPSAEGMFQYGAGYAIGKSIFSLVFDTDNQVFQQQMLEDVVNGIQVKPMDTIAHDKNETPIQVEVSLSAIVDDERGIQSIAVIIRNIAERKRFEEKIISLNETLEQRVEERTAEVRKARDEAEQASRSKSSFIANVSHEIRTPMNGVLGMLGLLKRGEMSEKQRRLVKTAETSAQALTVLINDLLDISKIESGKMQFENRAFNVISLVNDMAASLSVSAFEKEIDFVVDSSGVKYEWLLGDQTRIRQVLYNLVGNAIKFTHTGRVEIHVAARHNSKKMAEIEFKVIDTGVGIAMDDLDELFEAFTKEEKVDPKHISGTGLGLTISKQLCHKMGGDIRVNSVKDQGSTFVATIQAEISHQHLPTFNADELNECKALILRGEDDSWKVIERQLSAWGLKDITVESVSDYARITSRSWFDFVIIDSTNNYAECFTAATYLLKSHIVQDKENVIILTPANASYEGGNVFSEITKPFNPFVLWAKLRGEEAPEIKISSPVTKSTQNVKQGFELEKHAERSIKDYIPPSSPLISSDKTNKDRACVLIVDDTPINIDVAEGMLEDWGVQTIRATSGIDAITCLKQAARVDLVLMDCQMPEMDGLEATAKIRSGKAGTKNQFVPIVAITANAMAGTEEVCLAAGMNDYLTKPVEQDLLKEVLSKHIQLPKPPLVINETLEKPKVKVRNWEKTELLRRLKGRDDRATVLVESYIATANRLRRELQIQMNKFQGQGVDDIHSVVEELSFLLDGLIGSSANIGAKRLLALCEEMEFAVQEGQFDTAYKIFSKINDCADETIDNMKVFLVDIKASSTGVVN